MLKCGKEEKFMDNYEGQEFTGSCPKCDGDVDFLSEHYDYEHETKVEVWFCDSCSLSIKSDLEEGTILETMENLA
jgi:C4-type Zn-finger protein